jgi:hypothetical protein
MKRHMQQLISTYLKYYAPRLSTERGAINPSSVIVDRNDKDQTWALQITYDDLCLARQVETWFDQTVEVTTLTIKLVGQVRIREQDTELGPAGVYGEFRVSDPDCYNDAEMLTEATREMEVDISEVMTSDLTLRDDAIV